MRTEGDCVSISEENLIGTKTLQLETEVALAVQGHVQERMGRRRTLVGSNRQYQ